MAYTKQTWVDDDPSYPVDAARMGHIETGVFDAAATADSAVPKPSTPATNDALVWSGSAWVSGKIVNANVDAAAAIAYSKLSLGSSIVNADVASAAAIAISKLADPGSGNVVTSTGSGAVAAKPPGYEFAYAEKTTSTSITSVTEATPTDIVTAGAVILDGITNVLVTVYLPFPETAAVAGAFLQFNLWDGATNLGILGYARNQAGGSTADPTKPLTLQRRLATPSAASHTYKCSAIQSGGNGNVQAGAGGSAGTLMPVFLRVTKA